jgi:hypothetical protein
MFELYIRQVYTLTASGQPARDLKAEYCRNS